MNNEENKTPNFKDKTEALEFMVQKNMDRKRKEKWAKEFAAGKKSISPTKIVSFRKRLYGISAIAAVLVLGFVIVQFLPQENQNLDVLATNMIENTNFQTQESTRGSILSDEEINKSLVEALELKNYPKALSLYNQKTTEFSIEDKFFYAVSLIKTNSSDHDKVLQLTAEIMDSENEFFIEALWISAYAHLKLKDNIKAKEELEQLLDYNYQTKNVKELLSKI